MLADSKAFNGFAVPDIEAAREFYGDTLGLEVTEEDMGVTLLTLHLAGDRPTMIYPKPDFEPANYTILNFPVKDIDAATMIGLDEHQDDLAGRIELDAIVVLQ